MKKEFEVEVVQTTTVKVVLDTNEFDEKFMQDFRTDFYQFHSLEKHAEHLAQLAARGLIGYDNFVEGYGHINGEKGDGSLDVMDITVRVEDEDVETSCA
jgi:hypothetical protein